MTIQSHASQVVAKAAIPWCVFIGGSLVTQLIDYALRKTSAHQGDLIHASLRMPDAVFFGVHIALGLIAIIIAFRATRSLNLVVRLLLVAMQVAIGFGLFVAMTIGYSCSLGDCL